MTFPTADDDNPHNPARAGQVARARRLATPVDPRGEHELLRIAAGLAPCLNGPTGQRLARALAASEVEPVQVERVVSSQRDLGVLALVDGALYVLGRTSFLEDIGVRPRQAELRVAERIERAGETAFFIVAIARTHCLGVVAAPGPLGPLAAAADDVTAG